jgi:hypothetical protein
MTRDICKRARFFRLLKVVKQECENTLEKPLYFKDLRAGEMFVFTRQRPTVGLVGKLPKRSGPFVKLTDATFRFGYLDLFHGESVFDALQMERVKRCKPPARQKPMKF